MAAPDSSIVISGLVWLAFVWPPILVSACLVLKRPQSIRVPAFFVLGVLVCFGVQWLIGQLAAVWQFETMVAASIADRLQVAMVHGLIAIPVVSLAASLGPVLWLRKVLSRDTGVGRL